MFRGGRLKIIWNREKERILSPVTADSMIGEQFF